jgi:hypothetical protein
MNVGGLYGTNNGWDLPGYTTTGWTSVSLPDSWSSRGLPPGTGWYDTTFNLNVPSNSYVPVDVEINGPGPGASSGNMRAFIFVFSSISAARRRSDRTTALATLQSRLANGTYRLTSPLGLGTADGGQNRYYVTWEAAPGATPVISGSEQVTDWTLYNSSVPSLGGGHPFCLPKGSRAGRR